MTNHLNTSSYSHRQSAPLCLLLYVVAALFFVLGWGLSAEPLLRWLFPSIGVLLAVVAASFHHLTVEDRGDQLVVRFGPVPLFRRTVRYADIGSVEVGRTLFVDGWGIHYSVRGGWVWNLWGRECVAVHFRDGGTLRIGTDDAEQLAAFVRSKLTEPEAGRGKGED